MLTDKQAEIAMKVGWGLLAYIIIAPWILELFFKV